MPYSVPWVNNTPDGAVTPASDTDEELRKIAIAFHERMNDLVVDWLADPVVYPAASQGVEFYKRYAYNTFGPAVSGSSTVRALLTFLYSGTTDVNGDIIIDFNEFDEDYNINDPNLLAIVNFTLYDATHNDFVFPSFPVIAVGPRTLTYNVRTRSGAIVASTFVTGQMTFFFNTVPT